MTSRIHRGFHRIGIVMAVPVLLIGIGLAGREVWLQVSTSKLPDERMSWPDGSVSTVPSFNYHPADLTMALAALVLAIAFYATARAVGWVLDGFVGSIRT